jgi:histidinol-phosphate aminotransferase
LKLHFSDHIRSAIQSQDEKPWDEREFGLADPVLLAGNENPWGPSPAVAKALASAALHRYPDPTGGALVQALARKIGVSTDEIVLGSGSSEIVELVMRAFVQDGVEVITGHPAPPVYKQRVEILGGCVRAVPLVMLTYNLEGILASVTEKTRVIVLDNPNNPTGTVMNPGDLYGFLSEVPESVLVVLNESYVEFVDIEKLLDIFSLIRNTKNRCGLVVVRSFSKAYGLAGLRIGYGIMPAEVTRCLHSLRQPFNASTLAQIAALAALNDEEFLRKTQERTRKGREYLREGVKKLGCSSYPSHTNFLLIDVKTDVEKLYQAMLDKGVVVRSMVDYGLSDCIRVAVGTDHDNKRFLAALGQCLQDLGNA